MDSSRAFDDGIHVGRARIVCSQKRDGSSTITNAAKDARIAFDAMSRRYGHAVVEAGVGALVATTLFVMNGQSPAEALSYAACGTLAALVIDEAVNGGG